jgi:hypothetical protein
MAELTADLWRACLVLGGSGFSVGKSIGYGMVKRGDGGPATLKWLADAAAAYTIETVAGLVPATLHTAPLVDPGGERVAGVYAQDG